MSEYLERPYINAWAISVLSSRTMWFNAANLLVAALSLTEVVTLIPPRFVGLHAAVLAIVNMWLRTRTTRPVAFIAPGATAIIPLPKIDPPAPPVITD